MPAVRTHPGIRRRILIAFVIFTILPAAALSYLGMRAVGKVIETRLVRERATNAARVVSEMRLPLSPLMMRRLSEIFGQEDQVAAEVNPDAIGETLVSSLDAPREAELQAQLHGRATLPPSVRIGGHDYVIGTSELRDPQGRTHALYLLVDRHVLDDAKAAAVRPIVMAAAPVLLAMILAAVYVSRTITQPIRKLSAQIEGQVADGEQDARRSVNGESAMPLHEVDLDAPRELADLASTFNRMLGRLRETQQRLLDTERLAAVGKTAASVAHEVRNPLAGIRMNLQLLQQHLAREGRTDESLTIALAELERLDGIVQ
jgi:C4-dicarboxylate-specific signal transduction histidine kinase